MTEFTYQWNPDWEDNPTMPQLKVTKSSLNTFEFCHNNMSLIILKVENLHLMLLWQEGRQFTIHMRTSIRTLI